MAKREEGPMTKEEMIWVASVAIGKNMNYESLYYSDYMYGREDETEAVWEYVKEHRDNGSIWFNETYKDYRRY